MYFTKNKAHLDIIKNTSKIKSNYIIKQQFHNKIYQIHVNFF